ncbi:MAG: primosomal protein N' [Rickettsiales bacterium]|nr:primosomal protein N' [Rickettsiales bacterium]
MNETSLNTLFAPSQEAEQTLHYYFADIMLPLPFDQAFSYQIPDALSLERGDIVKVLFRNRHYHGVVWRLWDNETLPTYKTHMVIEKVKLPPIPASLLDFIDWMAHFTISPTGMVLKLCITAKEAFKPIKPVATYSLDEAPKQLRLTASRKKLLELMRDQKPRTKDMMMKEALVSSSVINQLIAQHVFTIHHTTHVEEVPDQINRSLYTKPTLSDDQHKAAEKLIQNVKANSFSTTLLDGVTGSGKTETYCEAIELILSETDGQALVLLPEIALTSQILTRFEKRFGFKPAVWHSNQSKTARATIWQNIINGTTRLVIGARSALFLPFNQLKLIVIDEEHEASYKQEEGVIYNARDMAIARAYHEQIPIVLTSATPSLETMHNVLSVKYQTVTLPSRYGAARLPQVVPIDMRNETLEHDQWISPSLRTKLIENFQASKQSMLYINRRGYAPLTICRNCGTKIECPNCSGWLSVHQKNQEYRLLCHHCGYRQDFPKTCHNCGADQDSIIAYGPGVEKIAYELEQLLPEAKIAVLPSDRMGSPAEIDKMITAITNGDIDIIVGTQMITKGYHFPKLSLVGVLDSEIGVTGGDLRGSEKTYQLLHQVAGRAGREEDTGYVYIQSYAPESDLIDALVHHDRDRFVAQELQIRNETDMPPFSRLASIVISSENEQEAQQFAYYIRSIGNLDDILEVLGPAPAALYKLRARFRYRILIKSPKHLDLSKILASWLKLIETPNSVRLKVDIDPYHFL